MPITYSYGDRGESFADVAAAGRLLPRCLRRFANIFLNGSRRRQAKESGGDLTSLDVGRSAGRGCASSRGHDAEEALVAGSVCLRVATDSFILVGVIGTGGRELSFLIVYQQLCPIQNKHSPCPPCRCAVALTWRGRCSSSFYNSWYLRDPCANEEMFGFNSSRHLCSSPWAVVCADCSLF